MIFLGNQYTNGKNIYKSEIENYQIEEYEIKK